MATGTEREGEPLPTQTVPLTLLQMGVGSRKGGGSEERKAVLQILTTSLMKNGNHPDNGNRDPNGRGQNEIERAIENVKMLRILFSCMREERVFSNILAPALTSENTRKK